MFGCQEEAKKLNVTYRKQNGKVLSVVMDNPKNPEGLQVFVAGETETPILGRFDGVGDSQEFTPIIPFSVGQAYEIKKEGKIIGQFTIPKNSENGIAQIQKIYPIQDTVPENLLKIYIVFSEPMQNIGNALDYITVYNETEQVGEEIFLPLETELWNRKHDRLTLWLDPGRIKTDLIPNRELGIPLKKGNTYTLTFSNTWKTASGKSLQEGYTKKWYVTERDDTKPQVAKWNVHAPVLNSKDPLSVQFEEPLDYVLAHESLHIENKEGVAIAGNWHISDSGIQAEFTPEKSWSSGTYNIIADDKLEDWAGNNLNRLFDENLRNESNGVNKGEHRFIRKFTIE